MENMRAGSGIKQITGKAGGIAAIVAAAHEQPDLLFRKPGAQGAQLAERRGRGIFHQDLRQDASSTACLSHCCISCGRGSGGSADHHSPFIVRPPVRQPRLPWFVHA